jgi:hypothetical protein
MQLSYYSEEAAGWTTGVHASAEARILRFAIVSRPTLKTNQPPIQKVLGFLSLPQAQSGWSVKLIIHLHIEPKLRMRELYLLFSIRLYGVVLG